MELEPTATPGDKPLPHSDYQRWHGWSGVVTVVLFLLSGAGGALLVWWALSFHPDDKQLWMVPFGLVVVGTPIVIWFSVFVSGARRRLQPLWSAGSGAASEDSGVVQHCDLEK